MSHTHTYDDWQIETYENKPKEQTVLDPTKKYRTRDGRDVRNLQQNHRSNRDTFPWMADVYEGYCEWVSRTYTKSGSFLRKGTHSNDLIEVTQIMEQPMDKLDFTKPETLQTRDGRPVRIYATDGCGAFPIHGAYQSVHGGWQVDRWDNDGLRYCGQEDVKDLIPKPARVTGWLNVYDHDPQVAVANHVYTSQESAKGWAGSDCIGQVFVDAEVQQ